MAIDYDKLLNWKFEDIAQTYTKRDTILYALGLGLGDPATDPDELAFVYEKDLRVLPTMAGILGYRGFWLENPETGVDWKRALGGNVEIRVARPLPPEGSVCSSQRVAKLLDKGQEKGALLFNERDIRLSDTGELLAVVAWTNFLRGDGGFGGPNEPSPRPHPIPERAADFTVSRRTLEQAAIIYRLSGDYNPLHIDPGIAAAAGFGRPVLHGQCTLGIAVHAVVKCCADMRPERIASLGVRFTSPVFPGEAIRTEIWRDGAIVSFRAFAAERDVMILDHGRAELNS